MVMTIDKDSKIVSFEGLIQWASVPPNKARPIADDYKTDANRDDTNYSIEVECSKEDFAKLKEYKLPKLIELKNDEAGNTYLKLKASKVKTNTSTTKNNGQPFLFKDIPVIRENGDLVDVPVANGSTALVRAKLIETKTGHTLRLVGVLVKNLIEYKVSDVFSDMLEGNPHEQQEAFDLDSQSEVEDDFPF